MQAQGGRGSASGAQGLESQEPKEPKEGREETDGGHASLALWVLYCSGAVFVLFSVCRFGLGRLGLDFDAFLGGLQSLGRGGP